MQLAWIGLAAVLVLGGAYLTYGRLLGRWFGIDGSRAVPARVLEDGIDYIPTQPFPLLAQHFSAISAAGPIVGPILAGLMFGWLPGLVWILLGCVFIGAAHDFASLFGSMRHGARSVAEILREHTGAPAFILFLTFIWLSLVLVIINFTDVTARAFVRGAVEIGGASVVTGPGVASSSLMYLVLAAGMGLLLHKAGMSLKVVGTAGVVLLFLLIEFGTTIPLAMPASMSPTAAIRAWEGIILGYCFVASVAPLWLFLQPRGFLGGILLYAFLFTGLVGLFFGGHVAMAPAFTGWTSASGLPLFPLLFVTIACGACSGFHGLVCSGTTSKQASSERHARPVAYGGMLLEGVVAVIALSTVMLIAPGGAPKGPDGSPDASTIFATGIARFAEVLGIPLALGLQFGFLALATFIYDTLDVTTRLGRYLLQELSAQVLGRRIDRFSATAITIAVPAAFLFGGVGYETAWRIFGAANQLLAALTLLGLSIWLRRLGRTAWYTTAPMLFVMVVTLGSLLFGATNPAYPPLLRAMSIVLIGLALTIIGLSLGRLLRPSPHPAGAATDAG